MSKVKHLQILNAIFFYLLQSLQIDIFGIRDEHVPFNKTLLIKQIGSYV